MGDRYVPPFRPGRHMRPGTSREHDSFVRGYLQALAHLRGIIERGATLEEIEEWARDKRP